jgi:Cys-tRNA(Pro)/Cys-tRNA(Cys) deacylase
MPVNNITRYLDSHRIAYQTQSLPAEKRSSEETARQLGVTCEKVFKSIVVERKGRGKTILAVVPGTKEVDLKALARAVGEKKVITTTQADAEEITGLQAGGISPLALLNKGFEFIYDTAILDFPEIFISGGERGVSLQISGKDLVNITSGKVKPISR